MKQTFKEYLKESHRCVDCMPVGDYMQELADCFVEWVDLYCAQPPLFLVSPDTGVSVVTAETFWAQKGFSHGGLDYSDVTLDENAGIPHGR